jgi:hypothetical protein
VKETSILALKPEFFQSKGESGQEGPPFPGKDKVLHKETAGTVAALLYGSNTLPSFSYHLEKHMIRLP